MSVPSSKITYVNDIPNIEKPRTSVTCGVPMSFETIDQIANAGVTILRDGLPTSYYNTISAKMRSVSLAQANAAAKTYVDPSKLVIVVVGDRKEIEPALRASKLGPVVVVDENGAPVSK